MNGKNTPPNARIAAIKELLDRAWGRPPQAVELSEEKSSSTALDYSKLTDKELDDLKRLLEKATTNGTDPVALQSRVKQ